MRCYACREGVTGRLGERKGSCNEAVPAGEDGSQTRYGTGMEIKLSVTLDQPSHTHENHMLIPSTII